MKWKEGKNGHFCCELSFLQLKLDIMKLTEPSTWPAPRAHTCLALLHLCRITWWVVGWLAGWQVSGLAVVGRDRYGVFPLRGKLLNVRDATHKQIMDNAEISSIKQIMGLQQGKQYDSTKSLRYGHLMIMTDQVRGGRGGVW